MKSIHTIAFVISLAVLGGAPVLAQGGVVVPTVQIGARAVSTGYEIDGVIEPVKQSVVSAQASGRVVKLLVKMGDRVKAGQLLATIDDQESSVGVQRSAAQVAQSAAELRNARVNFERTRDLRAQGFVSQAALDVAETQYQAAQAGNAQASAGARASALSQGYTRVTAPYDGWVLQTHVEAGDLAVPGKPIVTVYAPLPLRAVVQVPASLADSTRAAREVLVQLGEANGESKWVAPVKRSAMPAADPVSQTVVWRLDLSPQAAQNLLPGQQVRVRFVGGQANRTVVPAAAVLRRGELTAVYVATERGFVLRAVRLGADHGAEGVEIVAGLAAGERVALDPVKAGLAGAVAAQP
ncbi:MAG: efflux RND transporter periplasmic adaptor subunit [Burkholderiales bacterium]|nr:efflux RND transporter periplasmic adaptor subunit [Burkholderiales bacterium]MCZ8294882.1 efflux RND transporter periplasmic adaptor subunit [Hylemonella sp.]